MTTKGGQELEHFFKRRQETGQYLGEEEFKHIYGQIIASVLFCHSKTVYHSDLKPSNILVCYDENNQIQFKLADFGLARSLLDEHGSDGTLSAPCCTDYVATRWCAPRLRAPHRCTPTPRAPHRPRHHLVEIHLRDPGSLDAPPRGAATGEAVAARSWEVLGGEPV